MLKILIIPFLMLLQQPPVTYTGIEYIAGTDSLKVTLRINYELFLRDYQQTIFDDLDLEVLRSFRPFPADQANHYLNSKIGILVNNREVIGKLQKMDEEGDDARFIMLFRVGRKVRSITVKNTVLTGLASDVENLVIIKAGNVESTDKFTREHTEETFFPGK